MSYVLLGIIIGLFISTLVRVYSIKNIIGFSVLAIAGVMYGRFLAEVLEESMLKQLPTLQPLLIVAGGLALPSLKILFLSLHRHGKQSKSHLKSSLS